MSVLLDTAGQPLLDTGGLLLLDTVGVDVTATGRLPAEWQQGTAGMLAFGTLPAAWAGTVAQQADLSAEWLANFVGVDGTLPVERLRSVDASLTSQIEWEGGAAINILGRLIIDWLAGKRALGRFHITSSRWPVVSGRWPVEIRRVMPGSTRSLRVAYEASARTRRAVPVEILTGVPGDGVMHWSSRSQPTAVGTMASAWWGQSLATLGTVHVEFLAQAATGWLSFPIEELFGLRLRAPFPADWDGTDIIKADTDYIITSDPRSFLISAKRRYFNVPRPGVVVFKQPWEEVPLIFDFNEWLEELAAQVTFQAIGTIFVTPSGLTVGTASDWVIDGLKVQIPARGGTAGTSYTVTCRIVVLGTGEAFVSELDALVLVADR